MKLGWILLIVLGCILFVLTVSLLAVCAVQRKRSKQQDNNKGPAKIGQNVRVHDKKARSWDDIAKTVRVATKRDADGVATVDCGIVIVAFGPRRNEKLRLLRDRLEKLGCTLPVTLWTTEEEHEFPEWHKRTFSWECPWTAPTLVSKLASASLLSASKYQLVIDVDVYFGEVNPMELFRDPHFQTHDCLLWREPSSLAEEHIESGGSPNLDLGFMLVHKVQVQKAMQLVCHSESSTSPKSQTASSLFWWAMQSTGAKAHLMESQPAVARNAEADVGVIHWYANRPLACHYTLAFDQEPTLLGESTLAPDTVKRTLVKLS